MTASRRSMGLMLAFALLWAGVDAIAGHLQLPYSPYQAVWSRYLVHLSLMLAWWGWRDMGSLWRTQRPLFQLSRSLLMLVMPACWIASIQMGVSMPALNSVFWLSPILMLLLARISLGERAPGTLWIAALIGYLAVLLISGFGAWPRPILLLLPLGMAASFSCYIVMSRSLRDEPTQTNLFYTALGVFLVLCPFMPDIWVRPSLHDMLIFCAIGVFGFFALLALDRMTAAAPVSFAAPVTYLQLPCVLGFALMAQPDRVGRRAGLGVLLMAAAAAYVWIRQPRLRVGEAA